MKKIIDFIIDNKTDILIVIILGMIAVYISSNFAILHIRGNSMYPTYKDGDMLLIKREENFKVGNIVIFHSPNSWGSNDVKFVKRINGLDGDVISVRKSTLRINGEIIQENICNKVDEFIINEEEMLVIGDNFPKSNDSLSQYCDDNPEYLINKNHVILQGKSVFSFGGIF